MRGTKTIRASELELAEWAKAGAVRGLGLSEWIRVVCNEEAKVRGVSGLRPRAKKMGKEELAVLRDVKPLGVEKERRVGKRGKSVVDKIADVANETLRKTAAKKKLPACPHGIKIGWRCSFGCGIVKAHHCVVDSNSK